MRKIGILTLYHNNQNFGALLQAYALAAYINQNKIGDCTAEQITYDTPYVRRSIRELIEAKRLRIISTLVKKICFKLHLFAYKLLYGSKLSINDSGRIKANNKFAAKIPHSPVITPETVRTLNSRYDIFITGSDQVWNPTWFRSACFLDFVDDDKKKFSYAASMGINVLPKSSAKKIIPLIKRLDYISVREEKAKNLLEQYITDKGIETVVDPVLLLSSDEWNKVAHPIIKNKEYAFAYFLGENRSNIYCAKKAADTLRLPVASVPYIRLHESRHDKVLMDITVNNAGPAEFAGIIKNAGIVLTDSFHAVVFSIIFKKKFIAFKRDNDTIDNSMNSRIVGLLEELGLSSRIVTSRKQITSDFLNQEIDYTYADSILEQKIRKSEDFLYRAITS